MSHTRNCSNAICRDPFGVQLLKVRGEHGCSSVDIDGIVDHHCIITILNVFLLFVVLKLTSVLLHVITFFSDNIQVNFEIMHEEKKLGGKGVRA